MKRLKTEKDEGFMAFLLQGIRETRNRATSHRKPQLFFRPLDAGSREEKDEGTEGGL